MKKIKRVGTYGTMFLLYVVALQITTVILVAIPNEALKFCYESIVSGTGKSFFITGLVLQVGFLLTMFGRQMWR